MKKTTVMNTKKIVSKLLFFSIVLNTALIICLINKDIEFSNLVQTSISKNDVYKLYNDVANLNVSNLYSVENVSTDEKVRIAKELFEEHLNSMGIKFEGFGNGVDYVSNRKAVLTFNNYRITDVKISEDKGNKFLASVTYDVQCADEHKDWIAGVGDIGEDNWVIDKFYTLEIERYKDKYIITNMYY